LSPELLALQERIGHRFTNGRLLEQALTHRSHSADHYERLEFLGDAVLNLAVSALLYQRLSQQAEGDLSRIRANLVKQDTLHGLAQQLGVARALRLGEGELRSGGLGRPSILADVLEALIGAVYLDAGFEAAREMVWRLFQAVDLRPGQSVQGKDAKTALQEWLQGRKMKLPQYRVVATTGQAHQQTFEVVCEVDEAAVSVRGQGPSRRAAEQAAAAVALKQLLHSST
jgi:ribonuclease-3